MTGWTRRLVDPRTPHRFPPKTPESASPLGEGVERRTDCGGWVVGGVVRHGSPTDSEPAQHERVGDGGCAEDGRVRDAAPIRQAQGRLYERWAGWSCEVGGGCGSTRASERLRPGSPRADWHPVGKIRTDSAARAGSRHGAGVASAGAGGDQARVPGCAQPGPQGGGLESG